MKIKLNRDLWNHKSGEVIDAGDDRGTWAVNKGYASMVQIEPKKANVKAENKMIDPKYKRNAN